MMPDPQPFYCNAAIFSCTCCGYETEIYSSEEWGEKYQGQKCNKCYSTENDHFFNSFLYRSDIREEGETSLLNPYGASLPEHLSYCDKCLGRQAIHWTEYLVNCPDCNTRGDTPTMAFKTFVTGKHRDEFQKMCEDSAKPQHPWLPILREDGSIYYELNGPTSNFSAS